jgi:HlyD family secretion protein
MSEDRRDQLRSLSIDRSAEPARQGVSWPVLAGAIVLSAALAGGAAWFLTRSDNAGAPAPVPVAEAPGASSTAPSASSGAASAPSPAAPARAPRVSGLVASGYVVARRQATVSAEIAGRIADVLVEEGARVEEGDVLALLDDARAQLELDLIDSQVNAASARVQSLDVQAREARRISDRAAQLFEREIATDAARTAAEAQLASLQAQLRAAQADLESARVRQTSQLDLIERHTVRAPFAGVVIAKNAQVGEILFPGSAGGGFTRTGVATLVDMDSLEIEVDVNEGQIQRVSPGQRVETILDAYPDWRIASRVEAIIPTADRSRATIKVRVALEERDARILPDMAARVTFIE